MSARKTPWRDRPTNPEKVPGNRVGWPIRQTQPHLTVTERKAA